MNRPWMPFYVADYIADTMHLTTLQHGAYDLLIMYYWRKGKLPDDDLQLACICKCTPLAWQEIKQTIQQFFYDGWKHKRIDEELAKTADISDKRRQAALQMHSKKDANAEQLQTQPPSPSPFKIKGLNGEKNGEEKVYDRIAKDGDISKDGSSMFMTPGNDAFPSHLDDFVTTRGYTPALDRNGGNWFIIRGEGNRPKNKKLPPRASN